MAVDERARLQRRLEEVLGAEEARTLMSEFGSRGVTREELREELLTGLRGLEERTDAKLQLLEARMDTKLANLETRLTRTFVRTFYVSNAAMVLAVATLAFGAARLA